MMRVSIGLLLLAAPASAQAVKAAPGPVEAIAALPGELAGWRRGTITDFETRPGGAGLGAAAEYRPAAGGPGVATLYIYDRGQNDGAEAALPEGVSSPQVEAELTQAVREVEMLAAQRRYRLEGRLPAEPVPGPDGRPALRCESLALAFEGGNRADGFVCVGVVRGRFLKLRMTLPPGPAEAERQAVQALGREAVAAARLRPGSQ